MTHYPELLPLGREIRRRRKENRLSQEKLAELAGLHRNYIGGIERAEKNPGVISILKISFGLSVSPSDLFNLVQSIQAELDFD